LIENSVGNNKPNRRPVYVKVSRHNGMYYARSSRLTGGSILSSVASANGLGTVPEEIRRVKRGAKLQIVMLD